MEKVNGVKIYCAVQKDDDFEISAKMIFDLILEGQKKYPNEDRHLYLDIFGHRTENGAFDQDMFELQKDFIAGFAMEYLKSATIPFGRIENHHQQNNDVPSELTIQVASVV